MSDVNAAPSVMLRWLKDLHKAQAVMDAGLRLAQRQESAVRAMAPACRSGCSGCCRQGLAKATAVEMAGAILWLEKDASSAARTALSRFGGGVICGQAAAVAPVQGLDLGPVASAAIHAAERMAGTSATGTSATGTSATGTSVPGTSVPGTSEPGTGEPGISESGIDESGIGLANPACPFLVDGLCAAYAMRPLACRQLVVFGRVCAEGENPARVRPDSLLTPMPARTARAYGLLLPHLADVADVSGRRFEALLPVAFWGRLTPERIFGRLRQAGSLKRGAGAGLLAA